MSYSPIGSPLVWLAVLFVGLCVDIHLLSDHKGGVEADTKLTNDVTVGRLFFIVFQLLNECLKKKI